jgi:hypothetical protein
MPAVSLWAGIHRELEEDSFSSARIKGRWASERSSPRRSVAAGAFSFRLASYREGERVTCTDVE